MSCEYDVVCYEDKLGVLVKEVNAKIAQGWQPIGGISASNTYDAQNDRMYQLFAQALTKPR
jgi:hypothetical protein